MAAAGVLPQDLEQRVRAYIGELVAPEDVDATVALLTARASADAGAQEVFAAAHAVVTERVRVTVEAEADVLVREAGLTTSEAAATLGVPETTVIEAVKAASEIAAELETTPPGVPAETLFDQAEAAAEPVDAASAVAAARRIVIVDQEEELAVELAEPAPPVEVAEPAAPVEGLQRIRPRRRVGWLTLALLLLALAGVGTLVATSGSQGCDALVQRRTGAPVVITDACITGAVDTEGQPFEERDRFQLGETVILWFAYERQTTSDFLLTLAVLHDGEVLPPTPQFPLPADRNDAHVTLPRVFVDEPGRYQVQLRHEGQALASVAFSIVD